MTLLVEPVAGAAERAGTDHADCGLLNVQSVARVADPKAKPACPDYATAAQLVASIKAAIPEADAFTVSGNADDVVAHYLPRGYYVWALVYCTGQAVPCSPLQSTATHWITLYGDADARPYYQCWDASHPTIANLRVCSMVGIGFHAVVKIPGGENVALSGDLKNGLSVAASLLAIGRETGDDGARAALIGDDGAGFNQILQGLAQTPEGATHLAALQLVNSLPSVISALAELKAEVAKLSTAPPAQGLTLDQVRAEISRALAAAASAEQPQTP